MRKTKNDAVNQALHAGLSTGPEPVARPFVVEPHSFGFEPGIDLERLNQLTDELEADEVAKSLTHAGERRQTRKSS